MWHNCFVAWSCLKLLSDLSHIQDSKPFYTSVGQQRPQRLLLFWLSLTICRGGNVLTLILPQGLANHASVTEHSQRSRRTDQKKVTCAFCAFCVSCAWLTTFSLWLAPSKWLSTFKTSEIALILLLVRSNCGLSFGLVLFAEMPGACRFVKPIAELFKCYVAIHRDPLARLLTVRDLVFAARPVVCRQGQPLRKALRQAARNLLLPDSFYPQLRLRPRKLPNIYSTLPAKSVRKQVHIFEIYIIDF